jgi:hypothetical protein
MKIDQLNIYRINLKILNDRLIFQNGTIKLKETAGYFSKKLIH